VVDKLCEQVNIIYLEDLVSGIKFRHKLRGMLGCWFSLAAYRGRAGVVDADDPAVVLFTSGTEGEPKGVVLSHANLLSNCWQITSRTDFSSRDIVLNAMPMFHAFGLNAGAILPVVSGVRVFFYPSPLHYRIIPEIAYDINATILFGTNTFLAGYARFAHPYDFYSLRYVFAGAEKLQESTRNLWSERFGIRIFEGYGVTEASPAVAMNTAMENRPGTVGRMVPGMEYKLQAVEGLDHGGRLWIKGPNIMLGYLRSEHSGEVRFPESAMGPGWYDTGDIVTLDERGFITVLDRAKRFAKIGGEMVSLAQAEAFVSTVWPQQTHAVISVPDERRGEVLVLFTTQPEPERRELLERAREQGQSDFLVPRMFIYLKKLPRLGSGKVDYQQLREQYVNEATV
jgi:acyl-[acyl-carrier-protein]-phospholipid O-acyltransferase/long-chain-fatty-acid--[acyl-carrier-protein] ligase